MLAGRLPVRTRKRGPSTSTRGSAGPSPCSTASVVSCAMARILLGVRVCVRTLFYPQAWLFEPFSCSYIGPPERPRGRPSPPLLDDVKRTGHGIVSLNGKKWLPLDRLNPDQQGNGSATLSEYNDVDRQLLFQVVRYQPKDFKQRRPDGQGAWIWNLDGVRPVLYRLPELSTADPSKH